MTARPTCTPFSVARRRPPLPVVTEQLASVLSVPVLLDLRSECLVALSQLRTVPPFDLPPAIRARTRQAQREAADAVGARLSNVERELERRGALPAPDADDVRALPAWLGAWPPAATAPDPAPVSVAARA